MYVSLSAFVRACARAYVLSVFVCYVCVGIWVCMCVCVCACVVRACVQVEMCVDFLRLGHVTPQECMFLLRMDI